MPDTTIEFNFPKGHLGADGRDNLLTLVIRALSLKYGKGEEWADKYGTEYEDDTILIHPDYMDSECSCGQSQLQEHWYRNHPHALDCYYNVVPPIIERTKERNKNIKYREMCRVYKIPWNKGWGCACHCSCGVSKEAKEWITKHPHADRCKLELPNFWHKPTGIKVNWYKYIGREMKCNRESLTNKECKEILSLVTSEEIKRVIDNGKKQADIFYALLSKI